MFTVSKILDHLPSEESLDIKRLEKLLKLTKKIDRTHLHIALNALEKLKLLELDSSGNVLKVDNQDLIEARLRCSSKGYSFAIRDDGSEDIYIRDQNLNHAWHGDSVLVRITREGIRRRSPEGIVECILERNTTNLLGLVEEEEEGEPLIAYPLDDRISAQISLPEIDRKYCNASEVDKLVELKIDKYPIAQYHAIGHVVRELPLDGDPSSDKDLILTKCNLQGTTDPPKTTLKAPLEKNRIDLTNQNCLLLKSWESENSPSMPAVYAEANNGGIQLWIHAPTIAERLNLGNSLDLWLRDRFHSKCLGNEWIELLSKNLSNVSDFKVNQQNDSISVCINIDSQGNLIGWEFVLGKIKPVAQIGKNHMVALSNKKPKSRTTPAQLKPIKDYLNVLETIVYTAKLLTQRDLEQGLIELDLPFPNIENMCDILCENPSSDLYPWKLPLNTNDPQSLLTPIIKAANVCWNEHSKNLKLSGYQIFSEQLDSNSLTEVTKAALSLNLQIELDEDGLTNPSELAKAFSNHKNRRVLDKLLKHSMNDLSIRYIDFRKKSNEKEIDNTNNDINETMPWCSPGINYYNIANQFVIVTLLKEGKTRPSARHKNKVNLGESGVENKVDWGLFSESVDKNLRELSSKTLIKHINKSRSLSKLFLNSIVAMFQARSTEQIVGQELEAVISGVQSYGFFAELPNSFAEGLVHVSTLNDDWYEYRSRQNRLVGRKNRKVFKIGDPVSVKIISVDILRNQIDLEISEVGQSLSNPDNDQNTNINTIQFEEKSRTLGEDS